MEELEDAVDMTLRRTKKQRFMALLPLLRQLAGYGSDNSRTHYDEETRRMLRQ